MSPICRVGGSSRPNVEVSLEKGTEPRVAPKPAPCMAPLLCEEGVCWGTEEREAR